MTMTTEQTELQEPTVTAEAAAASGDGEATLILKPERPWHNPGFSEAQLQACIKVSSYNRHINCTDCRLLDGIVPPLKLFTPYLDTLQKKVVDKAEQQFRRNRSISRTMFTQLISTLKRVELPADLADFPQEKYQACKVAVAEGEALVVIMDDIAAKLRAELAQGNLKWVDKLS